ncbi:hypothetical protein K438DRAFT_978631 [Mycena galopus ATCC 62051]|nr:hypothetical protein K438DRAFT_978631 [Mycena galopus ATCC 62051]
MNSEVPTTSFWPPSSLVLLLLLPRQVLNSGFKLDWRDSMLQCTMCFCAGICKERSICLALKFDNAVLPLRYPSCRHCFISIEDSIVVLRKFGGLDFCMCIATFEKVSILSQALDFKLRVGIMALSSPNICCFHCFAFVLWPGG